MIIKKLDIIRFLSICVVLFTINNSCVEEYWPEIKASDQNLLVVEGKITNDTEPYEVILSRSSNIKESFEYIPERNAIVTLMDDQGNSEILREQQDGIYRTSANGIQGTIGYKYKISIQTSDGKKYESDFDELRSSTSIDNLSASIETKTITTEDERIEEKGVQFFVQPESIPDNSEYYYWEVEETYEYHADYIAWYKLDKGDSRNIYRVEDLPINENPREYYYCYKTNKLKQLFTFNGKYLNQNTQKLPLSFLPFSSGKSDYKYALFVKQYAISEQTYNFLNNIENQDKDKGDLYSKQPYQIRGNVHNVENPNETALGFFIVAGSSAKERILIQAPLQDRSFIQRNCDVIIENVLGTLREIDESLLPILITVVDDPSGDAAELPAIFLKTTECIDCRVKGGTNIKPFYWDTSFMYDLEENL